MSQFLASRASLCLLLICTFGVGCDKSSSNSSGNAETQGTTPAIDGSTDSGQPMSMQTPQTPDPSRPLSLNVKTNAYGGTIVVKETESGKEILNEMMPTGVLTHSVKIPTRGKYDVTLNLAKVVVFEQNLDVNGDRDLELKFGDAQLKDIRKAATCLLNIPGGGFGSGFLLGDRQTMATAAHCVACPDVEKLEIVFNPMEPGEVKFSGAKLIYFDSQQDVALLHLKEPVEDFRSYFWRTRDAQENDKLEIVGNPGRGGQADPMYERNATVKGTRPDEFFIDIELKPGYSGGPHCLAGTMDAVGITSFKIAASKNYKEIGQSYAKSIDIPGDAYDYWKGLNSLEQERKLDRESQRYEQRYGYFMANLSSKALILDSAVFTISCIEVVEDYVNRRNRELSRLSNPTASRVRRALKDFHEDYLEDHGPKFAARVKERLSPRLMMEHYYGDVFERALENENLSPELKEHLRKAHEHYSNIKEAAETVVDPSGSNKKGKSLEEFIEWTFEEYNSLTFHAGTVLDETKGRLE